MWIDKKKIFFACIIWLYPINFILLTLGKQIKQSRNQKTTNKKKYIKNIETLNLCPYYAYICNFVWILCTFNEGDDNVSGGQHYN